MAKNLTDEYERALAAEPGLRAIVTAVDALCALVRPSDTLCHGCVWDAIVKPLATPLIGWERGYPPKTAKDPSPDRGWRITSGADLMAEWKEAEKHRIPATTDTEKWLRTSEAWDAFTTVLLDRLETADPGNGHGICDGTGIPKRTRT